MSKEEDFIKQILLKMQEMRNRYKKTVFWKNSKAPFYDYDMIIINYLAKRIIL